MAHAHQSGSLKIVYGDPSNHDITDFLYDSQGRCVKISETMGGMAGSVRQFVWIGSDRKEIRDGSGAVLRQLFATGETISGANRYFEKDHLGSIRAMRNEIAAVEAEYSFDPFGRVSKLNGSADADFQYAGLYMHSRSGLNLTATRAYNPALGRFISRDAIGIRGGLNVYGYVFNEPIGYRDRLGTGPEGAAIGAAWGAAIGGIGGTLIGAAGGTIVLPGLGTVVAAANMGTFGIGFGISTGAIVGNAIEDAAKGVAGGGGYGSSQQPAQQTYCEANEDSDSDSDDSKPKKGSKPKSGVPSGTKPINQAGLGREQIHGLKEGVGAGPADWTGVAPNGDVITADAQGNAINHGHYTDYLP